MGTRRVNQRTMEIALENQLNFKANSTRGERDVNPWHAETGRLPSNWAQTFRDVLGVHEFVVWSYNTPIAWVTQHGEIVIPDESYSVTSTKYQNKCRKYLRARG